MELFHYSSQKFELNKKIKYPQNHFTLKPCGLWLSIEGEEGWEEWCKREGFRLEELTYRYEVKFKPDTNIVKILTMEEINTFYDKYKSGTTCLSQVFKTPENDIPESLLKMPFINWDLVARDYHGIYLEKYAPYSWMTYQWTYGWDCISACVWNLNYVENFKLIEKMDENPSLQRNFFVHPR